MQNLEIAFPEKTERERMRIAKDFYHNFIDTLIETLKLLSAPDSFFTKHFTGNFDLIDQFYDQDRAVQIHMGHNFNWEWGNVAVQQNIRYQVLGVYTPIANQSFDKIFKKMRQRNGTVMLSGTNMAKEFLPFRNTQYCLGLVADQSPGNIHKAQWFGFFNRKTAFTVGPAKNAIKNNTVVVFGFIEKLKRGYYKVTFEMGEAFPQTTTETELTEKFVRYLEDIIIKNPSMWLWSHRRWKHEWKGENS